MSGVRSYARSALAALALCASLPGCLNAQLPAGAQKLESLKLPILVELFHQMKVGRLRRTDPLLLIDADRVPGSGMLQNFTTPHQLTIADAATLMMS